MHRPSGCHPTSFQQYPALADNALATRTTLSSTRLDNTERDRDRDGLGQSRDNEILVVWRDVTDLHHNTQITFLIKIAVVRSEQIGGRNLRFHHPVVWESG